MRTSERRSSSSSRCKALNGGRAARPLRPDPAAEEGRRRASLGVGRRRPRRISSSTSTESLVERGLDARRRSCESCGAHIGGGGGGGRRWPRRAARTRTGSRDALAEAGAPDRRRGARVKVLALDYGSARTGVAVSDPTGTLARPLGVVERAGDARPGSSGCASSSGARMPERVVVGLPLTLRGERGEQARETERFVEACAALVDVPVELSTSASRPISQRRRTTPEDAARPPSPLELPRVVERAGVMPPKPRRRPGGCAAAVAPRVVALVVSRRRSRRRRVVVAGCAATGRRRRRRRRRRRAAEAAPHRLPEGFTRAQMARAGRGGRARSRERSGGRDAEADARGRTSRATAPRRLPAASPATQARPLEGFLFPATYDFFANDDVAAARARRSSRRSASTGRRSTCVRAVEEPHAVRRADHRVDDREGGARAATSGRSSRRVIYNRLHARMPLGIDATLRYGLNIPPTKSLTQSRARRATTPYNTRNPHGPAADADREPGPRLDAGGRAPGARSTTSTSCASRTRAPLLHGERRATF